MWDAAIPKENTSYSRKLHIPALPISPEHLTTNSGIPRTTVYLKYKVPPGIPASQLHPNPTLNMQFLHIPADSGIANIY